MLFVPVGFHLFLIVIVDPLEKITWLKYVGPMFLGITTFNLQWNLQCVVSFTYLQLKKHEFLLKTASSENTGRYFVSLAQGTINFSSNAKIIQIACFLYFVLLISKVLLSTLWYRLFG